MENVQVRWEGRLVGIQLSGDVDENAVQNGDHLRGEVDQLRIESRRGGEGAQIATIQIQAGVAVCDELCDLLYVGRRFVRFVVRFEVEQELTIDGHHFRHIDVRADLYIEYLGLGVEGTLLLTNETKRSLQRLAIRYAMHPLSVLRL